MLKGQTKRTTAVIKWSPSQTLAFEHVKVKIQEITFRAMPNMLKQFILTTDASSVGIGGVLSQLDGNGNENMIYTYSKSLDKAQQNYSVTDRELLAVVKCTDYFRHYLLGKTFILKTDHKALEYLWTAKKLTGRMLRWALKLQEFKFEPFT